ncbi:MAG: AbrB family transcriptional regulator [Pseudomonadota bacterium]
MAATGIWPRRAATILIALVGVFVFQALDLPLPWLLGPLLACLLAAFAQVPLTGLGAAAPPLRTILGVAVGATITPALFMRLDEMSITLAMVAGLTAMIGLVGVPWFHRVCGFDRVTAYYGTMPGGLQDMLIFGQEAGGDVRAMSLMHATRVATIVIAAPIVMELWFDLSLTGPAGAPARETPLHEMAIMAVCAIVGWKLAERTGLFGASILGPLILTAAASLGDLIHQRPPAEAIALAQFAVGVAVGSRYVGLTFAEFRRIVLASIVYSLAILGLGGAFAWAAVSAGLAEPAAALLAFAPGGQAEIAVLAIVAGVDAGFVVAHHVFRMALVIMGAPVAMGLMRKWEK